MRIALGLLGTVVDLSPMLSAFAMMELIVSGTIVGSPSLDSLHLAESAFRASQSDNGSLTYEVVAPSGMRDIFSSLAIASVVGIDVLVMEVTLDSLLEMRLASTSQTRDLDLDSRGSSSFVWREAHLLHVLRGPT